MKEYLNSYEAATKKVLERAEQIDRFALSEFEARYSLRDIAFVLRNKYKDFLFRDRYVGDMQFQGFTPYPKGFCALSAICVYELYGGADIWLPSAIKLGVWDYAPVVFLRDVRNGIAFDPTGDQFMDKHFVQMHVPYELGTPINKTVKQMRTPNKERFIKEIKQELDGR